MIQCLLTLLLAPRSAAAQGGSGGRGEDTHEGRVAMLDQFIRSGLAQEVTAYVRSFELTQIPDALADERRIFGQMLDQGLLAEAELSPLPYQIGQCFDRSGKSACASARKGDRRGRICFDPDRCAFEYPPRVYDENAARRMLVGTALHEKGHQFGFEEADASRISAYVRATLGASGPEGLTRPAASAVALGQASSGRDLGLEIERLRWQGAPQSARRILESCGGDFACLRNYSRDQLPDGLSRLLHESCLWPYLRYVPKTLFVRGEGFQSGDADPAAAPLCLKAGLAAVAAAALPASVSEFEKYEIGAARAACEAIPATMRARSWKDQFGVYPDSQLGPEMARGLAREACYARAAAALSSSNHGARLAWRWHPMRVLDMSCSLGRPRYLSADRAEDQKWLKYGVGGCYSRGFDFLVRNDRIFDPTQTHYEYGLLLASCRFEGPQTDLTEFAKAECLDQGRMFLLQDTDLRLLAVGCQEPRRRGDFTSIARCFESGLGFLRAYERPSGSPARATRYTLGLMLSAFTAPSDLTTREKMAASALASLLKQETGPLAEIARACQGAPGRCLEIIGQRYGTAAGQ